jgi:hypothetical protein
MAHPRIRRPVRLPIGLRFGATVLLVSMLSVLASCSDSTTQPPVNPVDDTSIEAQIRALFPSGASLQGAALTQIADIRQQIALSATAQAHSKTLTLVDFTMTSFRDGKLVGGTSATAGNAASRLVNALYQLVGMDAPNLPDGALSNDGAAKVVGPEGALVVTPSGAAGVQIPAGALDQQVLVTVTRLPAPSTPGTGPLPTSLKQYPPYYDFSTFPAVTQFGDSVRVGVCQVTDPSSAFYPPEPHDRLRLAHTVGSSIEILDRVGVNDFLRCTNVSASRSTRTDRNGWHAVLLAIRDNAIGLLRPASLYAAHGGLGGKVKSFSPFGAVDLRGHADGLWFGEYACYDSPQRLQTVTIIVDSLVIRTESELAGVEHVAFVWGFHAAGFGGAATRGIGTVTVADRSVQLRSEAFVEGGFGWSLTGITGTFDPGFSTLVGAIQDGTCDPVRLLRR